VQPICALDLPAFDLFHGVNKTINESETNIKVKHAWLCGLEKEALSIIARVFQT
jgi:hypothetical protein